MKELKVIKEKDIEEVILLGDDVIKQLMFNSNYYDADGISFYEKCTDQIGKIDFDKAHAYIDECGKDESKYLLLRLVKDQSYTLNDALNYSSRDLIERLTPIIDKAMGIFRHGSIQEVTNETNFCVDSSVDDEYLKNLFAMRVRDLMIVHAAQRGEKTFYLLTWGVKVIHDCDTWVTVTDDLKYLRKVYEEEWNSPKHEEYYSGLELLIYEFSSEKKWYKPITTEELWGVRYK